MSPRDLVLTPDLEESAAPAAHAVLMQNIEIFMKTRPVPGKAKTLAGWFSSSLPEVARSTLRRIEAGMVPPMDVAEQLARVMDRTLYEATHPKLIGARAVSAQLLHGACRIPVTAYLRGQQSLQLPERHVRERVAHCEGETVLIAPFCAPLLGEKWALAGWFVEEDEPPPNDYWVGLVSDDESWRDTLSYALSEAGVAHAATPVNAIETLLRHYPAGSRPILIADSCTYDADAWPQFLARRLRNLSQSPVPLIYGSTHHYAAQPEPVKPGLAWQCGRQPNEILPLLAQLIGLNLEEAKEA
ncbi:hypothetical protein [Parachitinimonas caeni]|uniref:HTH cro/C1-type domain-containing protein n=1 Tax=Parachitinimonas caeni TaxID=3031301 RepID=A0ABT7DVQ2_9NEIS|nr:hypothetical protein [Parachitinimonas caeni]MDK2124132.1 hypothetical protein [Parachitinimonas caeni]